MNQRYRILFGVALLAVAFLLVGIAQSQVISGDLVGTILDKSGATVPGARLTAVNVDTAQKYTVTANATGEYRFSNLPIGIYNVSAAAPSFATTTVDKVRVDLNKTSTLPITLEVAGTATSIEVLGGVTSLDTTTSQLSSTFESDAVANLPSATSGSGVLNLSLLSSGVASSGGVGAGSGPSVGGQRPRNNNFTIEGVDNNDKGVTGPLVFVPNDAVSEFSLLQNNFSPEFGHSSGGQFNTVVKSGTNEFHGLAYIYNDNRNYNALDTLQALEGLGSGSGCGTGLASNCHAPGPRYDFNRIGGQVGGPILKNKLFFFVNYEYEPLGQAGGAGAVCAPTAAGYSMINSYPGLSQSNLSVFEKYVAAGTLTGAGCAPLNWTSPVAVSIPTAGLAVVAPSYTNGKYVTASMDYDFSAKDQLRGRYIYNSVSQIDTAANLPAFFTTTPSKYHLVAINEYHQFSTNVQNELRLGYNRYANNLPAGNFAFPGLDSFPNLLFQDLGNLQLGPDGNAPQSAIQNTYQLSEAVSWVKGKHSLKFGVEGRKLIAPQTFTQRARGDYEYSSLQTYLQDGLPDLLAERSGGNAVYYGDQVAVYGFANDNWRIRPNFTINLGLRYEYTTVPYTERLQKLNAIASVPGLVDFREPNPAKNNWGPRVGFAYSPGTDGKTSIRGGFSIAYDTLYDNLGLLSLPPELSSTIDCAPVGNYACPAPFLAGGGIAPGKGGITTFPDQASAAQATSAYVPDVKSPKSINWTLGIQHAFANDYTLEVRYVGDRGIHLPTQNRLNAASQINSTVNLPTYTVAPSQATLDARPYDLNGIFNGAYGNGDGLVPAWENANFNGSYVVGFMPWASSDYNGLALQLTKKMAHGLQFVGSYTFSKTIDDATADVFSTVLAPRRPQDFQNVRGDYSNSILDHRHRFTLALLYDVPFFKNSNWMMKNLVGNWTVAPIYTYQSGQWVTAQNGIDSNLNGDSAPDRPVFNPVGKSGTGTGVTPLCSSSVAPGACPTTVADAAANPVGVVGYLANNPNAQYIQAGYGALGTVGRNTLQLNAINDVDLTLAKRLSFSERFKVEFQAQAFNVMNHPQYVGGYLNDIASIGFTGSQRNMLLPTNSQFNQPQSVFSSNPRTLQLALKIFF
jgi:hypothetical protein